MKIRKIKQRLREAEEWFKSNSDYDPVEWDKLFNKFLELRSRFISELEKKYEEKTNAEIKKIINEAENWLNKNHDHPEFENQFKQFSAVLRVYGKRQSMGHAVQKTLFDTEIKKG